VINFLHERVKLKHLQRGMRKLMNEDGIHAYDDLIDELERQVAITVATVERDREASEMGEGEVSELTVQAWQNLLDEAEKGSGRGWWSSCLFQAGIDPRELQAMFQELGGAQQVEQAAGAGAGAAAAAAAGDEGDEGDYEPPDGGIMASSSSELSSQSRSRSRSRSRSFQLPSSVTRVQKVAGIGAAREKQAPLDWSQDLAIRVAAYNDSTAPMMAQIVAFRSHASAAEAASESSNTFPLSARELSFGCSADSPLMRRPVKLKTMQHKWRFATRAPGRGGYMVLLKLMSKNTTPRRVAGYVLLNMYSYNLLDAFLEPEDVQRAVSSVDRLRDLLDTLDTQAPANSTAAALERRLLVEALRQQYNIQRSVHDVRPADFTSAYSKLEDRFHRLIPFMRRPDFMQFRELPPSLPSRTGLIRATAADVAEYNSALQTERGVAELDMQCNALPGLFSTNLRAIATIVRGLGVQFLVVPVLVGGDDDDGGGERGGGGASAASASASASASSAPRLVPGGGSAANYGALRGLFRAREAVISLRLIAYTDDARDELFANNQPVFMRVIVVSTSKSSQ
jgi:hypothetical protein